VNEPFRYLARCLDPVHIGSGGYRLGRVDMTIVREPATGIPKVPGTSLAGAVRAYAEMAAEEDTTLPEIRIVFGDAAGDQGRQGMLRFYDADLVLFPLISAQGTVWVSTEDRLRSWLYPEVEIAGPVQDDRVVVFKGLPKNQPVNLGWLLLEVEASQTNVLSERPDLPFVTRLAVVSEKLFHHLVNDHLEVRTSVEIDDETGAAKTGHLFTYEAIPRGTVLGFELAVDVRRGNGIAREGILRLLDRAFQGLKLLGMGGMGTRGFGRIEVLPQKEETAS
jgi:CRISPR-associated protein Cmr4